MCFSSMGMPQSRPAAIFCTVIPISFSPLIQLPQSRRHPAVFPHVPMMVGQDTLGADAEQRPADDPKTAPPTPGDRGCARGSGHSLAARTDWRSPGARCDAPGRTLRRFMPCAGFTKHFWTAMTRTYPPRPLRMWSIIFRPALLGRSAVDDDQGRPRRSLSARIGRNTLRLCSLSVRPDRSPMRMATVRRVCLGCRSGDSDSRWPRRGPDRASTATAPRAGASDDESKADPARPDPVDPTSVPAGRRAG